MNPAHDGLVPGQHAGAGRDGMGAVFRAQPAGLSGCRRSCARYCWRPAEPANRDSRRSRCPADIPAAARQAPVDPGGVRPHPLGGIAASDSDLARHRHDIAGRHRVDESWRLGQSPRYFRPRRTARHVPRGKCGFGAALGDVAAGPAHRARHRRAQPLPATGGARSSPDRCSAAACRRSARCTTRSSSAASMRSTTRSTRTPASFWWRRRRGSALAPEGGAHQSVIEPVIGPTQPSLDRVRAGSADELAAVFCCAGRLARSRSRTADRFTSGCRRGRLSSPSERWTRHWPSASSTAGTGCANPVPDCELAIAYCGAVAPEALAALAALAEDLPDVGVLAVTSPSRLHRDWRRAATEGRQSAAQRLLGRLRHDAALHHRIRQSSGHLVVARRGSDITASCRWGSIGFGQSGDLPDLYRYYGIDQRRLVDAAARASRLRERESQESLNLS